MKRKQLLALAERKGFILTPQAEDFFWFVESSMRKSIAKKMYILEEKLWQEGKKDESNIAYACALKALEEDFFEEAIA